MSLNSSKLKEIEDELLNIQLKLQTYLHGESKIKEEQSSAIHSISVARKHILNLSELID